MRILRVADVPDNRTGGMSRVIYCTGDAMRAAGHEVDYLFAEQLGPTARPRLRRFVIPLRLAKLVARQAEETGPYDVVEIHEPLAAAYVWRWRRGRRLPPPVVLSFGAEARGHAARLDYCRRKSQAVSLKQRVSPWSVIAQAQYAMRRAPHVICFNSEDAAHVRALGRRPDEVTCTRSGVSATFLQEGARRPPPGEARLLFLGTWIERKGVRDLAAALTRLAGRYPALGLTVAGCGCDAGRVLADFPESVRGRVEVIPRVANDADLLAIYRRHTLFVLPSYFEGQPLAMLEAAAMGLAVVTTDVCGMRDFIQSGEDGLLVAPADPDALAAALDRLLADPALAVRLAEAGRAKVRAHTWEGVAADMLSAYEKARRWSPS